MAGVSFKGDGVIHDRCAKLGTELFERQVAGKVLFGSFTREGADEALITYSDGHVGGAGMPGVGRALLFAGSSGQWKLVRWVDAPWLDCTEIPNTAPQRVLCLYAYTEQGISHGWFSVADITSPQTNSVAPERILFYTNYQDFSMSGMSAEEIKANEFGCDTGVVPKGKAYLVGLHSLHSSSAAPYFAVAEATYETGEDIASACGGAQRRKVRQTTGEVRFRVVAGKVTTVTPVQFVQPN